MNPDQIPNTLKRIDRWLNWRRVNRGGKKTKVPINPRTGRTTDVTDSGSWSVFETALSVAHRFDGVGFVFTDADDFIGIDFDNCLDEDGNVLPWACDHVNALAQATYVEVSPSGRGVKAFGRGSKPGTRCKRTGLGDDNNGAVEIYSSGRYFTVTGNRLPGAQDDVLDVQMPLDRLYGDLFGPDDAKQAAEQPDLPSGAVTKLTDEQIIEKARRFKNAIEFDALWRGDISLHNNDHSAADLALCNYLGFFSGGDVDQIDRLFRQSGLIRAKWDQKHSSDGQTYGEMSIAKAIAGQRAYYGKQLSRTQSGDMKHKSRDDRSSQTPDPVQLEFELPEGISLRAISARQTKTKTLIEFEATFPDRETVPLTITTAPTSIKEAVGGLMLSLGVRETADIGRSVRRAIDTAVRKVMISTNARRLHDHFKTIRRQSTHERGLTMADVLIQACPEAWGIAFKNDDGTVYSERQKRKIDRYQFCQMVMQCEVDACRTASDYPDDPNESPPVSRIVSLKRLAWGQMLEMLPDERGVDLGPESSAARRYTEELEKLFQATSVPWARTISKGVCDADAYTLGAWTARQIEILRSSEGPERWSCLHGCSGLDIWVYVKRLEGGSKAAWVGITHQLPFQISSACRTFRCGLPNTRSIEDLERLATRYGLTAAATGEEPPASVFEDFENGRTREFVVFSAEFTAKVLGLRRDK